MDMRTQSTVDRVYEDYEPYYEWAKDEGRFNFMIPGYRRDQFMVRVTSKPALKLKGEQQIIDNRWRRFDLEFPIPSDYDLDSVSAKFDGGRLHVKFAKLDKSKETTKPPEEETSRPKEEPSQKVDQQNASQEGTPKAKEDKAEAKANNEVSDQKTPQNEKEKQPSDEKEKTKTETADIIQKEAKKEDKTNNAITEKKEEAASKAPETKDAKPITRFKTRHVDAGPTESFQLLKPLLAVDFRELPVLRLISPGLPEVRQAVQEGNDQDRSQQKEQEPIGDEEEKKSQEKAPKAVAAGNDDVSSRGLPDLRQADQEGNDQDRSQQKEQEPIGDEKEKKSQEKAPKAVAAGEDDDDKKVRTNSYELSKTQAGEDDKDVDKRFVCNLVTGIKKPKIKILIMNIVVVILLVVGLWTYVKNALFRSSSSSSQGGSKFQEF